LCVLFLASGCGRSAKIDLGNTESETFKDGQYYQSLMGFNAPNQFAKFLERSPVPERVKYITKSADESPTQAYALKSVYEKFVNDPNAEVAAAAKEALSKVPSEEEFQRLQKEATEAQKK
jgi:hypothetical protein